MSGGERMIGAGPCDATLGTCDGPVGDCDGAEGWAAICTSLVGVTSESLPETDLKGADIRNARDLSAVGVDSGSRRPHSWQRDHRRRHRGSRSAGRRERLGPFAAHGGATLLGARRRRISAGAGVERYRPAVSRSTGSRRVFDAAGTRARHLAPAAAFERHPRDPAARCRRVHRRALAQVRVAREGQDRGCQRRDRSRGNPRQRAARRRRPRVSRRDGLPREGRHRRRTGASRRGAGCCFRALLADRRATFHRTTRPRRRPRPHRAQLAARRHP